jgi:hypothetical protein
VQPGINKFGNQGVGLVRCPGVFNRNGSIIRLFRLTERKTLQFRGGFFNLPNHPRFGAPGHALDGAGFGPVRTARAGRQVQLALRLLF